MNDSKEKEIFESLFKPVCIKNKKLGISKQEAFNRVTMTRLTLQQLFSKQDIDWRESESIRIIEQVWGEEII